MTYKKTVVKYWPVLMLKDNYHAVIKYKNKVYKTYVAVIYWPNIVSMAHKSSSQILACSNVKSQLSQCHKGQKLM